MSTAPQVCFSSLHPRQARCPFLFPVPAPEYLADSNTANTEGLIVVCCVLITAGLYGPQVFSQSLANLSPSLLAPLLGSTSVMDLWPYILSAALFIGHIPPCVINVVRARRRAQLPVAPVFLEWIPGLIFAGSCLAWLWSPYTTLLGANGGGGPASNRLMLFCLTVSFVFGRLTTKIILAHLTRQPFPFWTVLLVPLIGGAVLANLPRVGGPAPTVAFELWYLRAYFVFAGVVYFRWATLVIDSICSYLGINCLTIPSQQVMELKQKREQ